MKKTAMIGTGILLVGLFALHGIHSNGFGLLEEEESKICVASAIPPKPPEPLLISDVKQEEAPEPEETEGKNMGQFRFTVYTPYCDGGVWGYATATGEKSTHLVTCAVDPSVIPLGSTLYIDGLGELQAVDTGSAVKGKKIDIFYDGTVDEAYNWINQFGSYGEVKIVN